METMNNTSGGYGMVQRGAEGPGSSWVFGISATAAVLLVTCVVAFKMAAPDIKAAVMSHLPVVSQFMPTLASVQAPSAQATPAQNFMGSEH